MPTIPALIRNPILRFCERLGYRICKLNKAANIYGEILPMATYSPWNNDQAFIKTFRKIESHTLVDIYRCYELWQIIQQLKDIPGSLLEVGVWRGGSSAVIAASAAQCGITSKLYLCDTFEGVVKAGRYDSHYQGGEHADTSQSIVQNLLASIGLDNTEVLSGIFPDQTGPLLANQKFRFCHVDVDVYQSAKEISEWIWPRLAVGGVIIYDDYGTETTVGVRMYVDEASGKYDRLTVYNLNGHAVVIKLI